MREIVRIRLERISYSETGSYLHMTVSKGPKKEQLAAAVAEETASVLKAVLREEPFGVTKPGAYAYEVLEIGEGRGFSKMLTLQISKGSARTKRSVAVENELFLTIWNIFHFQDLPSKLPAQKRGG